MKLSRQKLFSGLIALLLIGGIFFKSQPDNKLHVYFCDVGQGDSIYIRFPSGQDMLIDGGPDNKVLNCLGKAMPFYDRQIDLVVLTHPQADHLTGLIPVIERYKVLYFVSSPAGNSTAGFGKLKDLVSLKKIEVKNLYSGEKIEFGEASFTSIWPEKSWAYTKLNLTLNSGTSVLGAQTTSGDVNDFSEMGILNYKNFDILFAGDGEENIQKKILGENLNLKDAKVEILKVPHHGAKTALLPEFVKRFAPEMAIISVGKNNNYGHPSSNIIKMLQDLGIKIERTDEKGTIEIVSGGEGYTIRSVLK